MKRRTFIKSVLGTALIARTPALFGFQSPSATPSPDPSVKRVLVMFKCHFDAGFIDTQANVVNKYFKEYFPKAINLTARLRDSGSQRMDGWPSLFVDQLFTSKAPRPNKTNSIRI